MEAGFKMDGFAYFLMRHAVASMPRDDRFRKLSRSRLCERSWARPPLRSASRWGKGEFRWFPGCWASRVCSEQESAFLPALPSRN